MAKKQEKSNHTSEVKPLTTNRTWQEFIKNDAFMMFPDKDDWRERVCYTMLQWAEKEDSLEIMDFALEFKIRRQTLYEWADRYPDFRKCFDYVKLIIGSRRRKGALTRKYDKDVVFKDIHRYDPEWLEINKYHSDMKKDEEKQSTTFIVNNGKPRVVSKEELIGKSEIEL
jgi:hypothetical protein